MSEKLRDLLIDNLSMVMPFKDLITHIMIKRSGDNIIGTADSRDGSIAISFIAKNNDMVFEHGACFGSLSYLNSILTSGAIKKSKNVKMELAYGVASNKKTDALRSITVSDGKKLEIFYQATDPFVNKLTKKRQVRITEWPIVFVLDTNFVEDFSEAVKIQASAPSGGDMDDIFTLNYNNKSISLQFGERGHQITLNSETEVESDEEYGVNKQTAMFSISQFQAVCNLLGRIRKNKNGSGEALSMFNERALRFEIETNDATYNVTLLAKKMIG